MPQHRERTRGFLVFIYWKVLVAAFSGKPAAVVEPIGIEPMTSSLQS